MKFQIKRAGRAALKTVAVAVDPFLGRLAGPRVLIYHQVGVDLGREMEVSTAAFTRQIDWMQNHGEIVDLATAIADRSKPNADRMFVLTFDDGFEDVYRNAFPLLRERGIPFTLYLTTNPIETGEPLDLRYPAAKPLSWDQIGEMLATTLVTVGAHTHTHPDLRAMATADIATELDRSNQLILERTGRNPIHFTYPWGWWSANAEPLVRARYQTATLGAGAGIVETTDPFRLNRLPIQKSDGTLFCTHKLARGAPLEDRIRRRLARYDGP